MDWFTSKSSSRPIKDLEFYQRKVLSFLFSSEGRDDFRCLGIPISQLGFYSPMHFISCIPLEMCEPYKSDKLFLASFGELRRGDKVLLLERGTEGIIRSAVFKGRRLGKSSEPEILLDGHKTSYSEEEVVPYKAHLRQLLGTSLIPEKDYDIRGGVLQWEEPSWEPGQEIYYKPEKRWIQVLTHETNQRGRPVVLIKMDGTNLKKEKTIRVSLQELQEYGVPLRIPRRLGQGESTLMISDSSSVSIPSTPDVPQASAANVRNVHSPRNVSSPRRVTSPTDATSPRKVNSPWNVNVSRNVHSPPPMVSTSSPNNATYATVNKRAEVVQEKTKEVADLIKQFNGNDHIPPSKVTFEKANAEPVPPARRYKRTAKTPESPPPLPTSPPPSQDPSFQQRYDSPNEQEHHSTEPKPIYRKKSSSKRAVRPSTEYFPPPPLPVPETSHIYQDPELLKFKSCNNLDVVSDDELEPFELSNYTNSLRSSARKIIQKQLAHEARNRSASLKLRPTSSRPHIAEIFTWDTDKTKMTKRTEPLESANQPIYTQPITANTVTVNAHSNNSCNNLSKCQSRSEPDIQGGEDQVDCVPQKTHSRPSSAMRHPYYDQHQQPNKTNPLEFNFAPLSSSELVKQQLAVVNRVLEKQRPINNSNSPEYTSLSPIPPSTLQQLQEVTCVSSDSSSHDNDSGRGSYQYIPEHIKESEKKAIAYDKSMSEKLCPSGTDGSNKINSMGNSENNSLNRRYAKNRSTSRSNSLPRRMSAKDEIVEEEQFNIPMPFNPGNIASVSGYGKGIQGATNSSYADATLCALFTCSNIFDMDLLFSKPGQIERGVKKEVRKILREKIVTPLRLNAYCKSENVTHLREAMLPLSSKMHSPLMDAQEFLYLLFDSALNTESFIEFSNGTKDFMHQIIARPKDRSKSQTVQFMLETSLGTSGLKLKQIPSPALFLCMPRCKGRLVYYEAIIPSLQLNMTKLLNKGPKQCVCEMAATLQCAVCHQKNGDMALDFCDVCKGIADQIHFRLDHSPVLVQKSQKDELLNLHSIICTRGNRYVAFVKVHEHRLSPWLFFDSMVGEFPEVTLLDDFGRWLDSLEKQPGHYREFAKLHPLLKRIMTDSHIYIYSRTHLKHIAGESLVI